MIFAFGLAQLSLVMPFAKAWTVGAAPFVAATLVKTALAVALMQAAWSVTRRGSEGLIEPFSKMPSRSRLRAASFISEDEMCEGVQPAECTSASFGLALTVPWRKVTSTHSSSPLSSSMR